MTVPKPTITVGHPSGLADENFRELYIREKCMREQADEIVRLGIKQGRDMQVRFDELSQLNRVLHHRSDSANAELGALAGEALQAQSRAGRIAAADIVAACERISDTLLGRGKKP